MKPRLHMVTATSLSALNLTDVLQSIPYGTVLFAPDRSTIFANAAASRLTGLPQEGFYLTELARLLQTRALVNLESAVATVLSEGTPVHLKDVQVALFFYEFSIVPIYDSAKKIVGGVIAMDDTTDRVELDRRKSEFISIASHQLRTPVSALNWLTEALQFGNQNLSPKQQGYIKDLATQSKRLIELIEDLLDFSRLELKSGEMAEKHKVEIPGFIEEFIKETETYAASKKHRIILNDKITEPLIIEINKKAFYNILQNLMSNAIDYSPENTAVTINLEKVDDFIKVSVSNKGPIIPDNEKPRIFGRFYRGESVRKIKQEGTGLGLYVAKEFIEEIGGKIGFESEEGKDTTFWFTLPIAKQ